VADHGELRAGVVDLLEDLLADRHKGLPSVWTDALLLRQLVDALLARQPRGVDLPWLPGARARSDALRMVVGLAVVSLVLSLFRRLLRFRTGLGDLREVVGEQEALSFGDAVPASAASK